MSEENGGGGWVDLKLMKQVLLMSFEKRGIAGQEVYVDDTVDLMSGQAVFLAVTRYWGVVEPRVRVEYPDGWWQAVKAGLFPRWLHRFCPVRYKVFVFQERLIYPTLRIDRKAHTPQHTISRMEWLRYAGKPGADDDDDE